MTRTLRRAALAAAAILLAPAAGLLPGVATNAEAHTYVSGRVAVAPAPGVVLGFSFGDPFLYGHVHYRPGYCSHGPLYYYPGYDVYTHYIPRHRYVRYSTPFRHDYRHRYHSHSAHRDGGRYDRRYDRHDRDDDRRDRGRNKRGGHGQKRGGGKHHDRYDR